MDLGTLFLGVLLTILAVNIFLRYEERKFSQLGGKNVDGHHKDVNKHHRNIAKRDIRFLEKEWKTKIPDVIIDEEGNKIRRY